MVLTRFHEFMKLEQFDEAENLLKSLKMHSFDRTAWLDGFEQMQSLEMKTRLISEPPTIQSIDQQIKWGEILFTCLQEYFKQDNTEEVEKCLKTLKEYGNLDRSGWLKSLKILTSVDDRTRLSNEPPSNLTKG